MPSVAASRFGWNQCSKVRFTVPPRRVTNGYLAVTFPLSRRREPNRTPVKN
jgi:hypothetical protein